MFKIAPLLAIDYTLLFAGHHLKALYLEMMKGTQVLITS
jgi:hypothetical protein